MRVSWLATPASVVAILGVGAIWNRLAERGLVAWTPGLWVTVAFALAVLSYACVTVWRDRTVRPPISRSPSVIWTATLALITCAAAVALYQPILSIGLLADDYGLLPLARELELTPIRWGYLRPFGLLVWWGVAQLGPADDVAVRLHLLNVLLHGVNAALVGYLAMLLGRPAGTAALAALLFLASPLAVEPVVWCSAIFDVLLATFALTLCIVMVRRQGLRPSEYALCLGLGVLMVATKETGVIAGPLALLAYWTRWGRRGRSGYIVAIMLGSVAVAYAIMRHLTERLDPRAVPSTDLDAIQRLLTHSAAALFVPLHDALATAVPIAAVLVPLALILVMVAWTFRWEGEPEGARLALFAAATVVLATAPTMTPFGVLGDLQGSRYLYVPMAVWTIALAAAILDGPRSRAWRLARLSVAALTVVGAALAVTAHFQPWHEARRVREGALLKLGALPPACVRVHARGVPDNVAGAFVFRNGLTEAAATIGREYEFVRESQAEKSCHVDLTDPRAVAAL
jgi:hypothetical protein